MESLWVLFMKVIKLHWFWASVNRNIGSVSDIEFVLIVYVVMATVSILVCPVNPHKKKKKTANVLLGLHLV